MHLSGAWFPKFERRLRRSDGRGRAREGVIPAAVHAGRAAKAECARGAIPGARAGRIAGMNKSRAMRSHRTKASCESKARHKKGEWI